MCTSKQTHCIGILLILVLSCMLCLSGCANQQEKSEPEPTDSNNASVAETPSEKTTFLCDGVVYDVATGQTVSLNLGADREVAGRLSEGKIVATWLTSDYDEKWDVETDVERHAAVFDEQGNELFDFTESVQSLYKKIDTWIDDNTGRIESDEKGGWTVEGYYENGVGFIVTEQAANHSSVSFLILDEEGNTTLDAGDFAEGGKFANYEWVAVTGSDAYDAEIFFSALTPDGLIPVRAKDGSGWALINPKTSEIKKKTNKEIVGWSGSPTGGTNDWDAEYNDLYIRCDQKVYDWDGNLVFDPEKLVGEDYDTARISGFSHDNVPIVSIWATKQFGNESLGATGIYDFVKHEWVVEPQAGNLDYSSGVCHGCILVSDGDQDVLCNEVGETIEEVEHGVEPYQGEWFCSKVEDKTSGSSKSRRTVYTYYFYNPFTGQSSSVTSS